jgi:hypothetical protein
MAYTGSLLLEISVVAAITALALALAVTVAGPIQTARKALVVGLVIGGSIHLAFELLGGNRYYCTYGAACTK